MDLVLLLSRGEALRALRLLSRARAGPANEGASMKVGVIEHFDSMHLLPGHKKCGVPHGHTYRIEVQVEGPVVNGMVIDFDILKKNLRELLKSFDHVDLNAMFDFPSCENISAEIHKRL